MSPVRTVSRGRRLADAPRAVPTPYSPVCAQNERTRTLQQLSPAAFQTFADQEAPP
jgi:hypothetical protein